MFKVLPNMIIVKSSFERNNKCFIIKTVRWKNNIFIIYTYVYGHNINNVISQ